MTTVAYRDGVLAADSRVTVGGMVVTDKATKVHRLRDGSLFGWAGGVEDAERLKRALVKGQDAPPNLDVIALRAHPDGSVSCFEGNIWIKQTDPYHAIGSGAPYAIGAMDAGADAVSAATIGSKRDTSSGGKIKKVRFKDAK